MNALAEMIHRAARQHASRVALIGGDKTLCFAEVDAESNRLASYLTQVLGLAKGERVAVLLPNVPEFIVTDFALIKAGLVRVPVNPRYAPPEIEFIVKHSGAAVLVAGPAHVAVALELRRRLTTLRCVLQVGADASNDDETTRFDDALAQGSPAAFAVDTANDDGYMIAYTSGTTGRPKGALTTVAARWANVFNCYANEAFVGADDVMLHVASLAHGSGTKVLPFFAQGACNVLTTKFEPESFFRLVQEHRVTVSWMVPTMVAMLADAPQRARFDLSSLRTIVYGGAPMPEPVLQRSLAAFGPIFVQIYGLTEAPHPDLVLARRDHLPDPRSGQRAGVGAAGRVAVGVYLKLVGGDGREVPAGEVGEVVIAGPHVMAGYWRDAEATAQTLVEGWVHTGDLAREDADGFVHIVDRKKEMLISGGYNVYPREVEDVLFRHPAVADCAVVGAPDDTWGETVLAYVVARQGVAIDEGALREHCARELAGYKKPRRIEFVAELPKTANGKVDKKALRAAAHDASGACA